MSKQTIQCKDHDQFMRVIASLVERHIGFEADADLLVITLTGGF